MASSTSCLLFQWRAARWGKRKTTLITDMVLSQEVMFRQKALEILQNSDMKFPYFPWIAFEDELRRCMEYGTVYNLASVKTWVALKKAEVCPPPQYSLADI